MDYSNKKDALIAELLGDTGKILENFEELAKSVPKHAKAMEELFDSWEKKAKVEHENMLTNSLPRLRSETKDLIFSEITIITKKVFKDVEYDIEETIKYYLNKNYIIIFIIGFLSLIIGIFIGKFLL